MAASRRAASSKPIASSCSSSSQAGSAQPRMYSLSGCRGMRQAEMRIVCAIRPASRSPSSSASTLRAAGPMRSPPGTASATSKRSVRPRTSDCSVAGTSSTSAVCAMSPKSMIPVTRPPSSRSRLSSVTSLWMSCARSAGRPARRCAANRARTRPSSSRRPRSSSTSHPARQLGQVLLVPPDRAAGGGMEEAPQRTADAGHDLADVRDRLAVELRRARRSGPAGAAGAGRGAWPRRPRRRRSARRPAPRAPPARGGAGSSSGDALDRGDLHLDHAAGPRPHSRP